MSKNQNYLNELNFIASVLFGDHFFVTRLAKNSYLCHAKTGITTRQGRMSYAFRSSRFASGACEIRQSSTKAVSPSTFFIYSLSLEASMDEFVLPFHSLTMSQSSICYSKLTIIHIPIGECKGDNIIPGIGNVNLQAVWRKH